MNITLNLFTFCGGKCIRLHGGINCFFLLKFCSLKCESVGPASQLDQTENSLHLIIFLTFGLSSEYFPSIHENFRSRIPIGMNRERTRSLELEFEGEIKNNTSKFLFFFAIKS